MVPPSCSPLWQSHYAGPMWWSHPRVGCTDILGYLCQVYSQSESMRVKFKQCQHLPGKTKLNRVTSSLPWVSSASSVPKCQTASHTQPQQPIGTIQITQNDEEAKGTQQRSGRHCSDLQEWYKLHRMMRRPKEHNRDQADTAVTSRSNTNYTEWWGGQRNTTEIRQTLQWPPGVIQITPNDEEAKGTQQRSGRHCSDLQE